MSQPRSYAVLVRTTVAVVALVGAGAQAAPGPTRVDLAAQDLSSSLRALAVAEHVDVLFDPAVVAGKHAPAVHGRFTADQALSLLLAPSGLTYRHVSDALVITTAPPLTERPAAPPADVAVSEILVIGSRSSNIDIPRSRDDIQPYMVDGGEQIQQAQAETLEDYLRTHNSADAEAQSLIQTPVLSGGASRSTIDLNGLGASQTLVLVDGRRMPSIPAVDAFQQSDLNGIPLAAIERVEVLTSTAGGIYGPGATGGVVNVVLRHDYDGGLLSASGGETSQGDAGHGQINAFLGHSFFDDRTQVMAAFSYSEDGGLLVGQREFGNDERARLADLGLLGEIPVANAVNIASFFPSLQLLPAYGGQTLAGATNLPITRGPLGAGGVAALLANAGQVAVDLPQDGTGALQSLLTRTRVTSGLLRVRQSFNSQLEGFVDLLAFDNIGWADGPRIADTPRILGPGQNGSPFAGPIEETFPAVGAVAMSSGDTTTVRVTAGLIAHLGAGWTGELDATYGRSRVLNQVPGVVSSEQFLDDTGVNIFGGADAIKSALASYPYPPDVRQSLIDNMFDVSGRLAGTTFRMPAGPATATLQAEYRHQSSPSESFLIENGTTGDNQLTTFLGQSETVYSAYGELRLPLVRADNDFRLLRGLELQLAGRGDHLRMDVPVANVASANPFSIEERVTARYLTGAFTAGLRVFPASGLMLRASYATGYLPPLAAQITPGRMLVQGLQGPPIFDPERPNAPPLGIEGPYEVDSGGSPRLQPERARSLSVGAVITPPQVPGLRVSIDYTRINKDLEINDLADGDVEYILDHEAEYPGRVTRLPLNPADIAAGDTGGVVARVDTSAFNNGRSIIDVVEAAADYRRATPVGAVSLYGRLSWEPSFRRQTLPEDGLYQTVGRLDGPLALRANVGLGWSRGPWSADLSAQIYGAYDVTYAEPSQTAEVEGRLNTFLDGGPHVPAQAYLDLRIGYSQAVLTWPGGPTRIDYAFGVRDLTDALPPLLSIPLTPTFSTLGIPDNPGIGYSPYGDPRGRRFEASVTARF